MQDTRFDEIRREHEAVLDVLGRLEAAFQRSGSGEPDRDRGCLVTALGEFLAFFEAKLQPQMEAEEQEIYPLLDRYLPPEVGSGGTLQRERETIRGLESLLRSGHERLNRGEPHAESEVATAVQDLALLLRDHIRKEDGVVNPLLRRLLKEEHRG